MIFKLGELFCGPGGLALGARLASEDISNKTGFKISHIWGVDKDSSAIETYKLNISKNGDCQCEGIHKDANTFCKIDLSNDRKVDALAFGFPCNDFSLVGKQKGMQGKYGNLYKTGINVLKRYEPDWFIAENVSGIHSANSGRAFKKILYDLEHAILPGYELTVHLYKFEQYGVPQYRHRYIIVGIRKDHGLKYEVPAPICGQETKNDYLTASKAISSIEPESPNSELSKPNPRVELRLKFTPPWHNAWFLDDLYIMKTKKRMEILQSLPWFKRDLSDLSSNILLKLIDEARLKCTRARMSHIYRRLDAHKPSYTITGSGGGGTHVYHWKEHRALTNREKAKLQSFPDSFEFIGSKTEVRKQIGMAVPPEGAKIIFLSILKTFAGISYPIVPASYQIEKE